MNTKIVVGYVERLKPRVNEFIGGFATVIIPELGDRQLAVTDCNGPLFIEAGSSTPVFRSEHWGKSPLPTDELVLEVAGVNESMKVVAWGYARFWKQAEAEIVRRPVYRVLRENRFHGQAMKKDLRSEVVFAGNFQELVAGHPRDGLRKSAKDPLAPVYKSGPSTALNRFEVKQNGFGWKPCEDPRPFPAGPIYRVMYWRDGQFRQLAIGTALQINWRFERGLEDPLAKYASSGEANGYLYFERQDSELKFAGTPKQAWVVTWTEVGDPRPLPMEEKAEKKALVSVNSNTVSKTDKLNGFVKTVHSLEELVVA